MKILSSLVLLITLVIALVSATRPVVLMHGFSTGKESMEPLKSWIEEAIPGIYVLNVEVGNGRFDSIFTTMDSQLEEFAQVVQADPNLVNGFNLIGFSQGTLIARAFVQRYNSPPVYNYIGWNGPQAGQFGTPFVNIPWIDKVLGTIPYEKTIQKKLAVAEYWKDPFKIEKYLERSLFLADINNEYPVKNTTYKDNLTKLNAMVLTYSTNDKTIIPKESGWFSFYADGSGKEVVPLQQQAQYTEDWLGLRTLDESNRLFFYTTTCTHRDHPIEDYCKPYFTNFTLPYLQN
ncbi:hypothetical protein RB653_003747 [Dictyostelium firmibasis]|uniref:palmitoyl-protein hydrolase n=1 Tax=Dictyostelium firmibasis TaxID=79012 RepID=A0AAN7TYF1_9MYCE